MSFVLLKGSKELKGMSGKSELGKEENVIQEYVIEMITT